MMKFDSCLCLFIARLRWSVAEPLLRTWQNVGLIKLVMCVVKWALAINFPVVLFSDLGGCGWCYAKRH